LAFSLALSASDELTTYNLQTTMRIARDHRLPLTVHLGETVREADVIRKNFRKSYIDLLAEYQVFNPGCLAVHFSILDKSDLNVLRASGTKVAVAPVAAAMKGFELPPLEDLAEAGVPVVFGTDWGPPRPWQTLRMAGRLHATSALELLRMQTSLAAAYAGVGQEVGSVLPGMKADLMLVRSPFADVRAVLQDLDPSQVAEVLLQRIGESDVSDVMVNGEFYVREGTLLMYAEEDLHADIRRVMALAPVEVPTKQPTTPVAEPADRGDEDPEQKPYEEGFRVIQRKPATRSSVPILPLPPPSPTARELPPNVNRVFGEDDI
jgi:5-methylthioadenosine/S-adenosylhomocysteine deaminase